MNHFMPEKIFVEESVKNLPLARQVLERCTGSSVETVPSAKELIRSFQKKRMAGFDGKKNLLLCQNRGRFLEPCPGTKKQYLCCGYAILNTGTGCPLDCSYCVLQAYLNNPFITLFVNRDDMVEELEANSALIKGKTVRLGTGEFMDSLALEHLTGFVAFIMPFLRKRKQTVLELKTKTIHIENLLGLDHGGAIVVSWSLNTEEIIQSQERGTATLKARISAACRMIREGYRVGFHFDPLVFYPGWEDGYRNVVALIAERIPPSGISWISIGSMRYMPQLKNSAYKRWPDTKIFSQEFIPGLDGKMRYMQGIRVEMYSKMTEWLRAYSEGLFIYYCMESMDVWDKTLGFAPSSNAELKKLLDQRV